MPVPHSQNPGQISNLPGVTQHITGHEPSTGKSIVQLTRPGSWSGFQDDTLAFNVVYSTSQFPPNLNNDVDLTNHENVMATGNIGLVSKNGSVCRMVDFAPGLEAFMHRTQSLDYGLVLEGEIEMVLDDPDKCTLMKRGDVAVQRATMHGWRNPSKTEWARMFFVLQECEELVVGGKKLEEDMGEGLPKSGSGKASL